MEKCKHIHVVIVAGGSGKRFGAELPKQYCELAGRPVLCHTVDRFRQALPSAHIITVVSADMVDFWNNLSQEYNSKVDEIVIGDTTRWGSVRNAIETLRDSDPDDIVLVHDGARPLVDEDTITRVVDAVTAGASVVPVVPVTDSLRLVEGDKSVAVERSAYRAVVTPQGFLLGDLRIAYQLPYTPMFTDDASVMAAAGMGNTILVDSLPSNIKITNPGDIALATWYLGH